MIPTSTTPSAITAEAYLAELRSQLAPITLSEREEILREIAAHIRDSAETGTPIEAVLTRLGPPSQIASEYRDGQLIRTASRSFSPVKLLRATLRVAAKGVTGIVVFFAAFIGYIIGGSLVIGGFLKPFFPHHIVLFGTTGRLSQTGSQFGLVTTDARHELLGWWGIPIAIVGGAIILLLTTLAIRGFLRVSQQVQRSL